jgi:hypothetical protein
MHDRFKDRIETIARDREQALCCSLADLAQCLGDIEDCPPDLSRALLAFAKALSLCPYDERGKEFRLKVFRLTLPILQNLLAAVEERRAEVSRRRPLEMEA